jgi:hypothetical protein
MNHAWSGSPSRLGRPQRRRSRRQLPPDIRTSHPRESVLRVVTAAVLYRCTPSSGIRIILLTCGAMGIRTPDLLHAISRQHMHARPSPQVTVPACLPWPASVRTGCCTSVLYQSAGQPHRGHAPGHSAILTWAIPPTSRESGRIRARVRGSHGLLALICTPGRRGTTTQLPGLPDGVPAAQSPPESTRVSGVVDAMVADA